MARRPNGRRVKIHHCYTIRAAAEALGVHKHTVSRWIAAGLPTTDAERPLLIRGQDIRAFLRAREPIKQKCPPGEFYCLSCRTPKRPAFDMAQYIPRTASRGLSLRLLSDMQSDDLSRGPAGIDRANARRTRHLVSDSGATTRR